MQPTLVQRTVATDDDGILGKLTRHLEYVNERYFDEHPANGTAVALGVPVIVQQNGSSVIPAAELRRCAGESDKIVINLALPKLRCPLYVYRYLLFHERLHQIYPSTRNGPAHTAEFREHEMRAPHRLKALRWLKKHCFPVMEG